MSNQYAFTAPGARETSGPIRGPPLPPINPPKQGYHPAMNMNPSAVSLLPATARSSVEAPSMRENPFQNPSSQHGHAISDKFSLSPDPSSWGADLSPNYQEPDDELHNPDPRQVSDLGTIFTLRGLANLGCLVILASALITLFAGFPLISYFLTPKQSNLGAFNLGGINATGQVAETTFSLVDKDTPQSAYTYASIEDGTEWELVFSDEFNVDGRTFYPGDDPFWEAVDLHYWGTNNLEWYDPQQIRTEGGYLVLTLDRIRNHNLNYMGGMMSSWNKFCFTGGILLSSVILPGSSDVYGLWPAVWTMGNLGRAGYGASVDGMWPYSYEACDVGTLPNQTLNGLPEIATTSGGYYIGDQYVEGPLSYLPGQRLSACTCPGEAHPGPKLRDGTFVGRSAPEIDVIEAQVSEVDRIGHVSLSAQWAPFNPDYIWDNQTYLTIYDEENVHLNLYRGAVYQQTTSSLGITNQDCYELNEGCSAEYGFEYKPGYEEDGAYITWISDTRPAWRYGAGGLGENLEAGISARPVPAEPMYIILNLGISRNFGGVDFENLVFPTNMYVDWIRVYQHPDRINIGCDPPNFPTSNYINTYIEAYTNPNLTTWVDDYQQTFPKNRLIDDC